MKINQKALLALVFGFVCFQALRAEAAESSGTCGGAKGRKVGDLFFDGLRQRGAVAPGFQEPLSVPAG